MQESDHPPDNDNDKIQQVPPAADVSAGVHNQAVG